MAPSCQGSTTGGSRRGRWAARPRGHQRTELLSPTSPNWMQQLPLRRARRRSHGASLCVSDSQGCWGVWWGAQLPCCLRAWSQYRDKLCPSPSEPLTRNGSGRGRREQRADVTAWQGEGKVGLGALEQTAPSSRTPPPACPSRKGGDSPCLGDGSRQGGPRAGPSPQAVSTGREPWEEPHGSWRAPGQHSCESTPAAEHGCLGGEHAPALAVGAELLSRAGRLPCSSWEAADS